MLTVCPHCQTINRVPAERSANDPTCAKCKNALLDGQPVELTDANFDRFISRTELPIVVDFWAAWCGPCQMMAPQFKQAAERFKGRVIFAKVDSDNNPRAAARFGIRSLPTLVMLRGGAEVNRQAGAMQTAQIAAWVNNAAQGS
ncbi:thioredoxin TrxC [Uliginosibacterium sp. H3]|uniref:Thioredoxin n=1 Tax=Uliginosibacterium silvisoli TaxID=3114758 RepID=A0ABU6K190_9RHOO|nr:thioredoxin TrxC [Uliginosibacterium sp. H3]